MTQLSSNIIYLFLKQWLPRLALALGGCLFVCTLVAGWYLYPILTMQEGASIDSFTFDDLKTEAGDATKFSVSRFTLGWFHSTAPLKRAKRILVLGFDQNDNMRPGRTDTMMLVEVHPKKGIGIISIPRDLWIPIPENMTVDGETIDPKLSPKEELRIAAGPEFGRINTVYRLGNRRFGKGMGHRLLKQVLIDTLDVEIDYTVAVNYEGFQQIVDTLGGVTVNVQCPIRDNFINESLPSGYELLDVPAGEQTLTGHQTLLFMRSRHGRTDMDRSRRQQQVLMGLRAQLLSEKSFLLLPRVLSQMMPFVKMDIDLPTILRVAVTVKKLESRIHGMVLTPPMVEKMTTDAGQKVLVLNEEKFTKRKKRLFQSLLPGDRGNKICPNIDVALHWRKKKKSVHTE